MQNLLLTVVTLVASHMHSPDGNNTNSALSIDPLIKTPLHQTFTKNIETEDGIIFFLEDSVK